MSGGFILYDCPAMRYWPACQIWQTGRSNFLDPERYGRRAPVVAMPYEEDKLQGLDEEAGGAADGLREGGAARGARGGGGQGRHRRR